MLLLVGTAHFTFAQRGYYDAPYKRYEADAGYLLGDAYTTPISYAQADVQSEASEQKCVNFYSINSSISWYLTQAADGLVVRYSVPNNTTATIGVYSGSTRITGLTLTSYWSWESLWNNGNPNNVAVVNQNPKMRFDEVRYKLPSPILANYQLKLVLETGNAYIDFVELEAVPVAITPPTNSVVYSGNGSTLQTFINANGGKKIFIPAGVYNIPTSLYFGTNNTELFGAGMWYTQLNFTTTTSSNGGLKANAYGISYSDLYLTTNAVSRSNSYKAINGVYSATSVIRNIWAEHFECGAWIGQYNATGPAIADGFLVTNCRFRNNYADGINLCKGTSNAIVEHCNFRNNGDDDQAIWGASGLECINNTFRNNTSENCWRASGVAFYGGKNNKAYDLIIRDNLESGIRLSNSFAGAGFNALGNHELHDITIIGCGTFNDLFNSQVGAIDIFCSDNAGTQVRNVKFTNIDIIDSKNDAIFIQKKSGDGIYNVTFENITANGTGKEYPGNNILDRTWKRGHFLLFVNSPNGNATFCNMNYSNRGGDAIYNESYAGIGPFSWTQAAACTPLANTTVDLETFAIYPNPVKDNLNIEQLASGDLISIFDATGKLLFSKTTSSTTETIDTSNLASGLYFVSINNGSRLKTNKFIKK